MRLLDKVLLYGQFALKTVVLVGISFAGGLGHAAIVDVTVTDTPTDRFVPPASQINVGDSVRWTWAGLVQHSTTHNVAPASRLWDSGLRSPGARFTNTFQTAGSFPYFCTVPQHVGQTGIVIVIPTNLSPIVTITSPPPSTTYAAPATINIFATATDTDGTVTNVQFLRNTTFLTNDTSPPFQFTESNVPAGNWALRAIATDNVGNRATNQVTVFVVNPSAIVLSNLARLSPTQFRFTYTGNSGLSYLVEKSTDLSQWQPLHTNKLSTIQTIFTDNDATADHSIYRVGRLPNP